MIQHVLAPRNRNCLKRCLNQPFAAAFHTLYLCKLKILGLRIKVEALRHSPSPHQLGDDCNPNICQSVVDVDLHLPNMVMCLQVYLQRHLLPVHYMTISGGGGEEGCDCSGMKQFGVLPSWATKPCMLRQEANSPQTGGTIKTPTATWGQTLKQQGMCLQMHFKQKFRSTHGHLEDSSPMVSTPFWSNQTWNGDKRRWPKGIAARSGTCRQQKTWDLPGNNEHLSLLF